MLEIVRVAFATVGAVFHDVPVKGTNVILICILPCKSLTGI